MEKTLQRAIGFESEDSPVRRGRGLRAGRRRAGRPRGLQPRLGSRRSNLPALDEIAASRALDREGRGGADDPPAGRRSRPRAGHGHIPGARAVPAGRERDGRRLGRSRLGLPPARPPCSSGGCSRSGSRWSTSIIGLREGSADDAAYVRRLCVRLKVPFHLRQVEGGPPRGASVEAWARAERHRAFEEVRRETGARRVALAQTLDDQAETVLLAVLTGRGLDAVSGMKPVAGPFVRPLLEVTRAETEACCRALHLRPRHGPDECRPAASCGTRCGSTGCPRSSGARGARSREPLAQTAATPARGRGRAARRALVAFSATSSRRQRAASTCVPPGLVGLPRAIGRSRRAARAAPLQRARDARGRGCRPGSRAGAARS